MKGIYYIKCLVNKKVYIGSSINIKQRLTKHFSLLKHNKHSNKHLQNIYNKYGLKFIKSGIIEECDNLIEREQFYIDNNKLLINIVIKDLTRPSFTEEVRLKIKNTVEENYKKGIVSKINNGSFISGQTPWNKGIKYKSTDHLKVPKAKTKGYYEGKLKAIQTNRSRLPAIFVFSNKELIKTYKNTVELYNASKKDNFELIPFMKLRNKSGRNGLSPYILQSVNVLKSSKIGKSYKGLNFKICSPSQ